MSTHRLRSYEAPLPGGYCFEEYHNGKLKKFPCEPMAEAQAQNVTRWRIQNHRPRATVKEAMEDVDHYQCRRLGNNSMYCIPCQQQGQTALSQASPIITPCAGCGAKIA